MADKTKKAVLRRKYHVRRKVFGTSERPRLSVFRSNRHIYAQIIDDVAGATLVSSSTMTKSLRDKLSRGGNKEAARLVGEAIAKQAAEIKPKMIVDFRISRKPLVTKLFLSFYILIKNFLLSFSF